MSKDTWNAFPPKYCKCIGQEQFLLDMLQRKIIKQQGSWAQNSIICPGLLKTGITAVLKSQTSGNIFNIKYRIVELSSSSPGHAFSTRAAWAKFFFFLVFLSCRWRLALMRISFANIELILYWLELQNRNIALIARI